MPSYYRMAPKELWTVMRNALRGWWSDDIPHLGAALSYYTLFALAPILIVAIAIAGFAFGAEAVRGEVVGQIEGLVGHSGALAVQAMLEGASKQSSGIFATVVGLIALFLGATGVFLELQTALNLIWRVKPRPDAGLRDYIRRRFISFGLVIGVGFLLLVSLVVSAALSALDKYVGNALPGYTVLAQALNVIVSLAVVTLLFAMIYKMLPDVKLEWRDVWVGAIVTAALFTIGKFLIGLYLGTSTTASSYGAAGSVVVLLLWVYYSAQIVLLGAEFTRAWVQLLGVGREPESFACPDPKASVA
jgi:membrane protein